MKKYKYEFEMPDDFQPGECGECPLSYEEWREDEYGDTFWWTHCPIDDDVNAECPLIKFNV